MQVLNPSQRSTKLHDEPFRQGVLPISTPKYGDTCMALALGILVSGEILLVQPRVLRGTWKVPVRE